MEKQLNKAMAENEVLLKAIENQNLLIDKLTSSFNNKNDFQREVEYKVKDKSPETLALKGLLPLILELHIFSIESNDNEIISKEEFCNEVTNKMDEIVTLIINGLLKTNHLDKHFEQNINEGEEIMDALNNVVGLKDNKSYNDLIVLKNKDFFG